MNISASHEREKPDAHRNVWQRCRRHPGPAVLCRGEAGPDRKTLRPALRSAGDPQAAEDRASRRRQPQHPGADPARRGRRPDHVCRDRPACGQA
ncbi:hypothetical protein G6F45_014123 [Rhizopus arrhizus]|nr:hypothetical protein G6F45_014123 [Rhizopus arrhizus]